jgi:AraC-like DNA-binding protein
MATQLQPLISSLSSGSAALALKGTACDELSELPRNVDSRPRLACAVRLLHLAKEALRNGDEQVDRYVAATEALVRAEANPARAGDEPDVRASSGGLPSWKVARVARFVDANLGNKITVKEIASLAQLSPAHFSRAFRSTVGEAPYAYVIRRRIERAREMILLTSEPLAEIAVDCGLGDQQHLTRLFRRFTGTSPGLWRRRQAEAISGETGRFDLLPRSITSQEGGSGISRPHKASDVLEDAAA